MAEDRAKRIGFSQVDKIGPYTQLNYWVSETI